MFLDTNHLKSDEIFLKLKQTSEAVPEKKWVPAYHFDICRVSDGVHVGKCDLRIGNTEKLYFGGNIGYEVFEPHRGNRYAAKACRLLCELAQTHGLKYLYITCVPDNHASRKTCEHAGGVLQGIICLPTDSDRYLKGERQSCQYLFELEQYRSITNNTTKENRT